jgi:hypothetical protein
VKVVAPTSSGSFVQGGIVEQALEPIDERLELDLEAPSRMPSRASAPMLLVKVPVGDDDSSELFATRRFDDAQVTATGHVDRLLMPYLIRQADERESCDHRSPRA